MEEIKKFYSEISENEAVISLDQNDFNSFSSNVNIITLQGSQDYNEWLKKKVVKAKSLLICVLLPKDTTSINLADWISNILTIFVSVEKPIFGIYKKDKQKRTKITLIFE